MCLQGLQAAPIIVYWQDGDLLHWSPVWGYGDNHWIITPNWPGQYKLSLGDQSPIYGNQQWWPDYALYGRMGMGFSATISHPAIERTVTLMTASLYLLLLKPQVFYLGWIQKQPVIHQLPSVHRPYIVFIVCLSYGFTRILPQTRAGAMLTLGNVPFAACPVCGFPTYNPCSTVESNGQE